MTHPRGSAFARGVVALRWLILAAWMAGAVAATTLLPSIAESQTGALGDLVPNDADAIDAEIRSSELFGFPLLSRTVLVQRDRAGLTPRAQARVLQRAARLNDEGLPGLGGIGGALPITNAIGGRPLVRERSTTALTYLFFAPDVGSRARQRLARRLADGYLTRPGDAFVGITGAIPARGAQAEAISDRLPLVELGTVLLVIVVCGLHFRSLGAPLVTLVAILLAYLVAVRVMAGLGQAIGVSVPSEVEPVVIVLLFGIVTDYSIFYLSRFRRKLAEGLEPRPAAIATVSELSRIIAVAALTVVAACSALLVARLGFFQAFGPGTAIAVLVGGLAATTLLPACLTIAGRAVFWPSRPGIDVPAEQGAEETPDEQTGRPVRSRLARLASEQPVLVIVATVALLLAGASGLMRTEVGNTLIRGLPGDSEARRAYEVAGRGFTPGVLSPTVLIVERAGITLRRDRLVALQRRLEAVPGVAQVVGPRQQPLGRNLGAVYSRSREAVRYLVVFDADPLGAAAIARLRRVRAELPAALDVSGLPGARVGIAGDTALSEETVRKVAADLERIALAVLLVVIVILVAFLRALIAPLLLVGASVLALGAALGLTTYLFQDLLGYGELTYYVPFAASVLLVALGSDYNVFLTGRIWQEAALRPFREAVGVGAARASKAITVAGIVLALSFGLLAVVPVRAFYELGFAMACGLLIDAFIVRTLLVPALITLVGTHSHWPARFPVAPSVPVPAAEPGSVPSGALRALVMLAVLISHVRRGRSRGP